MEAIQKTVIGSILILIGMILLFYLASDLITKYTGFSITSIKSEQEIFNQCIKEKNIILYINTNNAAQTLGKLKTTNYLEEIKIINCLNSKDFCISNGITAFPTFIIENNKIESDIAIEQLKQITGCE